MKIATTTHRYDSQNHLVAMNGGAVQMRYDGDGDRLAKSANGVITRYLVDDLNPAGGAPSICVRVTWTVSKPSPFDTAGSVRSGH